MNWSDNLFGEAETRVEVFHVMGILPGHSPSSEPCTSGYPSPNSASCQAMNLLWWYE